MQLHHPDENMLNGLFLGVVKGCRFPGCPPIPNCACVVPHLVCLAVDAPLRLDIEPALGGLTRLAEAWLSLAAVATAF